MRTARTPAENATKLQALHDTGQGRTLVIVGNGPSVAEVDLRSLKAHPSIDVMSINAPVPDLWPTSHWLFCDDSQYEKHVRLWKAYRGQVINSTSVREQKANTVQVKRRSGKGFSTNLLDGFYIGRSSVFAAMQASCWLGYEHAYIFGCDMCSVGKLTHFYGTRRGEQAGKFEEQAGYYEHAAKILPASVRERFTFCSSYNPFGFVERFGTLSHETAVEQILAAG